MKCKTKTSPSLHNCQLLFFFLCCSWVPLSLTQIVNQPVFHCFGSFLTNFGVVVVVVVYNTMPSEEEEFRFASRFLKVEPGFLYLNDFSGSLGLQLFSLSWLRVWLVVLVAIIFPTFPRSAYSKDSSFLLVVFHCQDLLKFRHIIYLPVNTMA